MRVGYKLINAHDFYQRAAAGFQNRLPSYRLPVLELKIRLRRSDVAIGKGTESSFAFLIVVKLMAVILCPPERVEKVLEGAVAEVEIGSDAGEASL